MTPNQISLISERLVATQEEIAPGATNSFEVQRHPTCTVILLKIRDDARRFTAIGEIYENVDLGFAALERSYKTEVEAWYKRVNGGSK